jgi:hypothetical protein
VLGPPPFGIAVEVATVHRGKNETVAGLTDDELFGRLFRQRHEHDASLLLIAQAYSLVYSFQGEAITGDDAELPVFAEMIGTTIDEMFRGVGELQERELVQQRSVWRAVLPHAIANRLAKMALRNIPAERIQAVLINGASARLLKSFSRRLGYLHDSETAIRLVESWLAPGGVLSDVANLNTLGLAMFENVAPVIPEAVLAALERVPSETLTHREALKKIIWSIAYEPKLFERCAELLLRIGATEQPDHRIDPDRYFTSLFFIAFSGTHASIEQRIKVLDGLLRSDESHRRMVGIKALRNILEARHFGSGFEFEFGARPRDYGFYPKTGAELKHWYVSALKLVEVLALSDLPVAGAVQSTLASQFRGLWSQPFLQTELGRLSRLIARGGFWRDGWIAVSQTLKYDYKGLKSQARTRLVRLEKALRPQDLLQKVRGIVLGTDSSGLELEEVDYDSHDDVGSLDRINRIATSLGKDAARDPKVMKSLLPEMMTGQGRLWSFGCGLAAGAIDPRETWNALVGQFVATIPEARRNTQVLGGYLDGLSKRNSSLVNDLLDHAVSNERLAAWFPELQTAVTIDARGAQRLQQSLTLGKVPLERFRVLAWGRAPDPISGADLKRLLLSLAEAPAGWDVAIEVLYMRLFSDRQEKKAPDPALIETGRQLLKAIQFKKSGRNGDHRIGSLIKACLTGPDDAEVVRTLCGRFKEAVAARETYSFEHDHLLRSIFKAQPAVALDAFFGGDGANQRRGCEIISDVSRNHANPLDFVPLNDLTTWCIHEPGQRFPLAARAVTLFKGNPDQTTTGWTETVLALIDKAPDRVAVLKELARRLRPMSWSGSRAVAMEMRLPLLQQVANHADPAVAKFARDEEMRLKAEIEVEKQNENREDKDRDERFE